MKIVFWGTPKYAAENLIHLVNSGYEIIAVVTQPDRKRSRGKKISASPVKKAAIDLGITVYETHSIKKDNYTKNLLNNLNSDVYIVVAFGQILPREILDQPKLGCWNSHASLLPAWRGAAPIQWSIINDDRKTGICIIAMEEGLDTGPVIEQETTYISDDDNLEILTERLSNISSKLLIKLLQNLKLTIGLDKAKRLKELKAIDQSKLKGPTSYARQIKKEDYLIDWNQKARTVLKIIKGLYPNAYTFHKGKRIKIIEACQLNNKSQSSVSKMTDNKSKKEITPGTIVMLDKKDGITLMTNDYPIIIKSGKLEGKNKTDGYTLSVQSDISVNNILGV